MPRGVQNSKRENRDCGGRAKRKTGDYPRTLRAGTVPGFLRSGDRPSIERRMRLSQSGGAATLRHRGPNEVPTTHTTLQIFLAGVSNTAISHHPPHAPLLGFLAGFPYSVNSHHPAHAPLLGFLAGFPYSVNSHHPPHTTLLGFLAGFPYSKNS